MVLTHCFFERRIKNSLRFGSSIAALGLVVLLCIPSQAKKDRSHHKVASKCDFLLGELLSYQGTSGLEFLNEQDFSNEIEEVYFYKGRLVSLKTHKPITLDAISQFVYTNDKRFLITKQPSLVGHSELGKGRPVYLAGLIEVNNGVVTSLAVNSFSAYKGSPDVLRKSILFFREQGVDLNKITYNLVYIPDEGELNVEILEGLSLLQIENELRRLLVEN